MSNSEHNDLDKLLKDNLSDKAASVPGAVWDNIEAELFPKKKRRGFFWLFFSAGLLIGGLALGSFFLFNGSSEQHTQTTQTAKTHKTFHQQRSTATGVPAPAPSSPLEVGQDLSAEQAESVASFSSDKSGISGNDAGSGSSASSARLSERELNRSGHGINHRSKGNNSASDGKTAGSSSGSIAPETTNTDADHLSASTSSTVVNSQNDLALATATEQPGTVDSLGTMYIMPVGNSLADFLVPRKAPDTEPSTTGCGFIVYGGPSFYEMALFKDYFVSGDLSNRSFAASGMEIGMTGYFRKNRLGWYLNLGYNRKQAAFQYDVAITENDYFEIIDGGELPDPAATIPFENISDNGSNSCFLAEDFTASYTVTSWQLALGGTMEFLRWRKFSFGGDLRIGLNLSSKLELKEWTTFSTPSYEKERYNAFRPAGGLWIWCQLSRRFAVGLMPMYSWQFHRSREDFIQGTTKELIVPVGIRIGL